jgi:cytochrome b6-f complex iron-sulfur subunit
LKAKIISRRGFLRGFGSIIVILVGYLWFRIIKKDKEDNNKRNIRVTIPFELAEGISFHDYFIIYNESGNISIFSSKCTHLGCKINKSENNVLICACHGSRFSFDGKVINGPASKDLQKLFFEVDKNKNKIVIYI